MWGMRTVVSASRSAAGVQTKVPLLSMPSTRGAPRGRTFSEGPRRRRMEILLGVVGVHLIVYGLQAGTIWAPLVSSPESRASRVFAQRSAMGRAYLGQRSREGVALGLWANWLVDGSSQAGEEGNGGDFGNHVDGGFGLGLEY